jgi:hypothetical protein
VWDDRHKWSSGPSLDYGQSASRGVDTTGPHASTRCQTVGQTVGLTSDPGVTIKQMLKGGTAGAILVTVVLFSGAAFAGTGLGGVFNLGQTNQVNAATT